MNAPAETTPALELIAEPPLAWIVIRNPPRMNAFTTAMWSALPGLLASTSTDDAIRVIVLRGQGERAFCAGADISEFATARTGQAAREYDRLSDEAFLAVEACTKPTIAMVHGFCLGGGLGVAASCDIRVVDEPSQFAIPAARLGIGYRPEWLRPLLALAPPAIVKEMLFTGRRLSSAEAVQAGLVNRVVPTSELLQATRALASEIAANAPLTVAAAKQAIDALTRRPESADMSGLRAATTACFDSEDYREGQRAFLEKRRPVFRGR